MSITVEAFFQSALKDYKSTAKNVYETYPDLYYSRDPLNNCGNKLTYNKKDKKVMEKVIINCEKKKHIVEHGIRGKIDTINRMRKKLEQKKLANSS